MSGFHPKWSHRDTQYHLNGDFYGKTKKETELTRKHQVKILFSDTQYAVITEDARRVGLPIAVYLRNLIAEHGLTVEYKIARDDKAIHNLTVALSRIGNNLNQLMRYFHQNGANTTGIENDIRCCIRQIYDMSAALDKIESDTNYGSIKTHSV